FCTTMIKSSKLYNRVDFSLIIGSISLNPSFIIMFHFLFHLISIIVSYNIQQCYLSRLTSILKVYYPKNGVCNDEIVIWMSKKKRGSIPSSSLHDLSIYLK